MVLLYQQQSMSLLPMEVVLKELKTLAHLLKQTFVAGKAKQGILVTVHMMRVRLLMVDIAVVRVLFVIGVLQMKFVQKQPIMEELGVPWNLLEDGFGKYRRLMDGDLMTMDEMYVKIFAEAGLKYSDDVISRIVDRDQASYTLRNEETIEFMKDLKARGFKIGILTNMCRSFVPRFKENFADAIALADALVISTSPKRINAAI